MPPALRKCVVWTRVPPGKPDYQELPDHGLIVMFHLAHEEQSKDSRPGYSLLYYDGAVHVDTNVVYVPSWDQYMLSTMMMWDFSKPGRIDHSNCLH
jgi:hypothetical protein